MEFLSKTLESVQSRVARQSPRTRLLIAVIAVTAIASAVIWGQRVPSGNREWLLGGRTFSPVEIANMEAAFARAGLNDSRIEDQRIEVPADQKGLYLKALDSNGALPPNFDDGWRELVASDNPFSSRYSVELKQKHADQQKLACIIEGITGIERATVQYDEVKTNGWPPTIEKRAMVAISAARNQHLTGAQVEAVRDTVAGYIGGLKREDVTVTDLNAGRAYRGDASDALNAMSLADHKEAIEHEYKAKILERLKKYPNIVAAVNAHFAEDASRSISQRQPVLVTASIDLPRSYLQSIWRSRHSHGYASAAEELRIEADIHAKIERAVAAVLPPPGPEHQSAQRVTVTTYQDELAVAASAVPSDWKNRLQARLLAFRPTPIGWGVAAGIVAATTLAMLLFRRKKRGRATSPAPARASRDTEPERLEPESTIVPRRRDPAHEGPAAPASLHEQLSKLVKQNPDAAANVLNNWLSDAA